MAYTTIDNPGLFFNTVLHTGNGGTQSITGVGFQTDWSWIKRRDGSAFHVVTDSVRGATKQIYPNDSQAEGTRAQGLQSFDSDGYTLGNEGDTNGNSQTYVGWTWKAGGSASSNSDGSITSTVSANTTAGFSILTFTTPSADGDFTVGHGLGSIPQWVIVKTRGNADNWQIFHHKLGNANIVKLNTTDASASTGIFGSTNPTSSVFTLNKNSFGGGLTAVAYCFAEKKGFSKFGSYTGNGNADGTFVYTGFKPAMIIIKRTDGSDRWVISDNKRDPDNPVNGELNPNDSATEDTSSTPFDFLSNGFKIRRTGNVFNASGGTYIYMAFAESPFVNSKGVPTNAR